MAIMAMRSGGLQWRRWSWIVMMMIWLSVSSAQECTKDGRCDTHERCPIWANEEGEW